MIQNESLHTIGYIRYPMQDHIKLGGGSKELGHDRISSHGGASSYSSAFYHGRAVVDCEYCAL